MIAKFGTLILLSLLHVGFGEYQYPWRNLSPLQLGEIHCGPDMSLYYGRGDRESAPYLYEQQLAAKDTARHKRWATGHYIYLY